MTTPTRAADAPLLSDDLPGTLCAAFQRTAARCPDRPALGTETGADTYTWAEYADAVRGVAAALAARGVGRGDTVALLVANSPAFHVLDTAALHLGAVPFSVYATSSPEQIAFQLRDAGARIVVCDPDREAAIAATGVELDHLLVLDEAGERVRALAAEGRDRDFDLEAAWRAVRPDDLATLVYTSGTTGPPKGVQITHRNAVACTRAIDGVVRFPDPSRILSYLPLAHVAERNNSHWFAMCLGFTVTSCRVPGKAAELLPEVRPSWFFGVPRVFEKMQAGLEASADPETRETLLRALDRHEGRGGPAPDEHALARLRARIGLDRAAAVNVGAAPAMPEMIRFFHAIGVPLAELWGMSEMCGAGTVNPSDAIRIGTVGPPVRGVEIRVDPEDGEIQVRGEVVTPGYRGRPDLTAEATTPDGWLRTGDVGTVDADGYLTIRDRKKELIINAGGKNMSPVNIESNIKSASLLVGQVVAIGDRRPYNVALVVLDPDGARAFARDHGLGERPVAELAHEPAVLAEVAAAVEAGNARLSRVETVKRFRLLAEEWQPGGDELTPTMKLRRREIAAKYADAIDELYAG
jgi:long-chain acyl-CoA synthetase